MPIKGVTENLRLPRLGKIHLGVKDTNGRGVEYPKAVDYFVCPPEVQAVYGEKPRALKILFPVEDEMVFASHFFRSYSGSYGLVCKGDGESADRTVDLDATKAMPENHGDLPVPEHRDPDHTIMASARTHHAARGTIACWGQDCPAFQDKACKPVMMLQFMLPMVPGLGVWQIDTSSWNGIRNVLSGIKMIRAMVGKIAMVPLLLTIEPMEVSPEGEKKKMVYVLNIKFDGTLMGLIQQAALTPTETVQRLLPTPDDEIPEDLFPGAVVDTDPETGEVVDQPRPRSMPRPQDQPALPKPQQQTASAKRGPASSHWGRYKGRPNEIPIPAEKMSAAEFETAMELAGWSSEDVKTLLGGVTAKEYATANKVGHLQVWSACVEQWQWNQNPGGEKQGELSEQTPAKNAWPHLSNPVDLLNAVQAHDDSMGYPEIEKILGHPVTSGSDLEGAYLKVCNEKGWTPT